MPACQTRGKARVPPYVAIAFPILPGQVRATAIWGLRIISKSISQLINEIIQITTTANTSKPTQTLSV